MALFQSDPHSLCILRLSAIGDVCNTIAAVQAIQRQWPQTRITWVTGKLEAELIQSLPDVQVIVFDKKLGWRAYTQLWQQLKSERFDALLHMQYAFRASIATLGSKRAINWVLMRRAAKIFKLGLPMSKFPHRTKCTS